MRFLAAVSLFALTAPLCVAQNFAADAPTGPASAPKKPSIFDTSAIDKTVDPCTDFYKYACGNWDKANPIPADRTAYGRFTELADYNNYLVYSELKQASEAPKTPLQKKYGDYYAACMNTDAIDKLGYKPIQPQLDAIAKLSDKKDLAAFNARQDRRGGGAFFFIGVTQDQKDASQQVAATGQGGLTLPDRDYYLNDGPRFVKLREGYVENMKKTFELIGDTPEQAAKEADAVMSVEIALAKGSLDRVKLRDPATRYHPMTIADLQAKTPNFNWAVYLQGIGLPQAKTVVVTSLPYLDAANDEIGAADLATIKSYLRWHAVHGSATMLSKPFEETNFDFFARTLNGQKEEQPRWKRCTSQTDRALGEAVGQDWVKQNFPGNSKAETEKLVKALEAAMAKDLQTLPWMSPETKVEAKKKLDAIADKIGYPDKWRDYSSVVIKRDDYVGNAERAGAFERKRNLSKFGTPVDPTEWGMTPPTVNAYYSPSQNNINFPAGILQPPFYQAKMDPAVNFGAIGVVIGHEMTHGFDDQGSQYDPKGNVRVWFTEDDLKKFRERSECYAKEYDGFQVAPGQNLNGHLTLGENSADNAGIRIAFQALTATLAEEGAKAEPGYGDGKRDGYTPQQRFFISFAQVWCGTMTEQAAINQAKTNPHSTGEWRVKGTVQNFDEFGKAFGCKVGQPMMPASGGCRTW
ncbi:MAG TPA: M13 family metallopeptidase [Acidobacteriaceae bacterium]|jgi:putative endopeptidase